MRRESGVGRRESGVMRRESGVGFLLVILMGIHELLFYKQAITGS